MKIISVVGARPNFIKIAPFVRELKKYPNIEHLLVHTGQHYDDKMSKVFFTSLDLPEADINLGIGGKSHARQVGETMIAFEEILENHSPEWVVVVGDVNATLACSITAKKLNIKVCHIEAGLRSGDISMPEEINRIITDSISDLLLVPDNLLSSENLLNEGAANKKIKFVGNIMIDTLDANYSFAERLKVENILIDNAINQFKNIDYSQIKEFYVLTMHRPSNVDNIDTLRSLVNYFTSDTFKKNKILWPIHPRTQKQLKAFDLWEKVFSSNNIILLHPLGYHDMLKLNIESKIMFTDSGGLQEECLVLGTPCVTMRLNTERPITLFENGGLSVLVGNDTDKIQKKFEELLKISAFPIRPKFWDGHTAKRCLEAILNFK